MSVRKVAVAVAIAVFAGAASVTAQQAISGQQKGTLEFGGFGGTTAFDNSFGVERGWGGGARVGVFFSPRLSVELEANGISSDRPNKAHEFNVGQVSGRLLGVPVKAGRLSLLLGAGLERTDTYFLESYGVHGLLGAKVNLMNNLDLRIDGVQSYMFDGGGTNTALRAGLSVYRTGRRNTVTVTNTITNTVTVPGPSTPQRPDSVSAAETRRLRALEASYDNLRDSLGARPVVSASSASSAESATMLETIYFQHDRSDISAAARTILADKVTVFHSNPAMRITIVGFASQPGTDVYNMALGLRRAEAAKAYLVSQGISASRIEIATRGEGQLVVQGPGEVADAQNRRGQFSILLTEQP